MRKKGVHVPVRIVFRERRAVQFQNERTAGQVKCLFKRIDTLPCCAAAEPQ